jgi:uncharacterized membrane protein
LVANTVNPLIDSVNNAIGPLAKAVGLELGGADVRVLRHATCTQPLLVG